MKDDTALAIRQGLLAIVAGLEREYDMHPLTSELRKEVKRLRQDLAELKKERQLGD